MRPKDNLSLSRLQQRLHRLARLQQDRIWFDTSTACRGWAYIQQTPIQLSAALCLGKVSDGAGLIRVRSLPALQGSRARRCDPKASRSAWRQQHSAGKAYTGLMRLLAGATARVLLPHQAIVAQPGKTHVLVRF